MNDFSIRDKCRISSCIDADTFVGIMCKNGEFSISFPMGFNISDDNKGLRKDILLLVNAIAGTIKHKDSVIQRSSEKAEFAGFPFKAYVTLIYDFYSRGYYKEKEAQYIVSRRGKIDWNKTIKTQKAYVQGNDVFYLEYVTKKNMVRENELITLIHKYFVYEAFTKIGWLFTSFIPEKPEIKYNARLFESVLKDKLCNTFKDKNKVLFKSMLEIMQYVANNGIKQDYKYGTYRFEYVWEALIDKVFGINGKEEFYPATVWDFGYKKYDVIDIYENASLRPDTIMKYNGDFFVLDAKYYKYGIIPNPGLLPKSTDINKQITYGEYIAEQNKFHKQYGDNYKVYNAFIMPYDSKSQRYDKCDVITRIGQATGNWKSGTKEYEKVQGILIDTKYLMRAGTRGCSDEIERMADVILKYV